MRLAEILNEGMPLGKVLPFPELLNTMKSELDNHGVGWKMSKRGDNSFLFSAENDFGCYSMLVLEAQGNDFFVFGHGLVFPDKTTEIIERGELPTTAASASEVSQSAIAHYHDADLSEWAEDN